MEEGKLRLKHVKQQIEEVWEQLPDHVRGKKNDAKEKEKEKKKPKDGDRCVLAAKNGIPSPLLTPLPARDFAHQPVLHWTGYRATRTKVLAYCR